MAAHGLTEQSPISAFVEMIPMNLYAVFTLIMVLVVIAFQLDIGPMRQHERAVALEGASCGMSPRDVPSVWTWRAHRRATAA